MNKSSYVYILTNSRKTVLYIGVTTNLQRRIYQHKMGLASGFTKKYSLKYLIHYEIFENILDAIQREKSLKGLTRAKKEKIIAVKNPGWKELLVTPFATSS